MAQEEKRVAVPKKVKKPERFYQIFRDPEDGHVYCRWGKPFMGGPVPWPVVHSPTGFDVGYEGDGPADLALAILAHYFEEVIEDGNPDSATRAWGLHQEFTRDFIANRPTLPPDGEFRITNEEIEEWLLANKP